MRLGIQHEVCWACCVFWKFLKEIVLFDDVVFNCDASFISVGLPSWLKLEPVYHTISLGDYDMAWSHHNAERLRLQVELFADVRILRSNMENFLLVSAEEDVVLTVPSQRRELDAGVIAFNYRNVNGIELLNLKAPGINEIILAIVAFTFVKHTVLVVSVLEGRQNRVELDFVLGQDGELALGIRVEAHAEILLAELELLFLSDEELLGFEVENRDIEVGQTANNHEILAAAGERHSLAL